MLQAMLSGWTEKPDRYWFRRCDMCGKRRPFQLLHECYPPLHAKGFGWWFGCVSCVNKHEREHTP